MILNSGKIISRGHNCNSSNRVNGKIVCSIHAEMRACAVLNGPQKRLKFVFLRIFFTCALLNNNEFFFFVIPFPGSTTKTIAGKNTCPIIPICSLSDFLILSLPIHHCNHRCYQIWNLGIPDLAGIVFLGYLFMESDECMF